MSFLLRPLSLLVFYILVILIGTLWPFNFFQGNGVKWVSDGGLQFLPPSSVFTPTPVSKLTPLERGTIAISFAPGTSAPNTFAKIVAWENNYWNCNFALVQNGTDLLIVFKGKWRATLKDFETEGTPTSVSVSFDQNHLHCFLNGKKKETVAINPDPGMHRFVDAPLIFGSGADGKSFWAGAIYSFAIVSHTAAEREAVGQPPSLRDNEQALSYTFVKGDRDMIISDHGPPPASDLTIASLFVPYERTVLENPLVYWRDKRAYVRDILINIALFIPLGYFVVSAMPGKKKSTHLICSVLLGCAISLFIELAQVFLASRYSNLMDVVTNTVGAFLGYSLHTSETLNRIRSRLGW